MSALLLAPYDRGLEFGGSQRATSLAEALEARGFTTTWHKLDARRGSFPARLATLAGGLPDLVSQYAEPSLPAGDWDVVVAEHSFLGAALDAVPVNAARVADFHNLEWQQLLDIAGALPVPRRWYYALQSRRMASYEAGLARIATISCFPSEHDMRWAERLGGHGIVVPNTLPRATTAAAERIRIRREARRHGGPPVLLYVGKLDFLPNFGALRRFVRTTWPAVVAAEPAARLVVAGRVPPGSEPELEGHGVSVLGFVDDLTSHMVECTAAALPIGIRGGTSLRVLWFALAGVPMIGSPEAFRGFDGDIGAIAETAAEWAWAVQSRADELGHQAEAARSTAAAVNGDPGPWDRLVAALRSRAEGDR